MEFPIPIRVLNKIERKVKSDKLSSKDKLRLIKVLVELWLRIYLEVEQYRSLNLYNRNVKYQYGNIHSKYLNQYYIVLNKKKLGPAILLKFLEDINLVDVNHKYSSGNFSKSYRYNPDVLFGNTILVDLDFDRLTKDMTTKEEWISKFPEQEKIINDCYSSKIDLESYFSWLDANKGKVLGEKIIHNKIVIKKLDASKTYLFKIKAVQFNLGVQWFQVADTGRLYSSVANLSNTAMCYLSVDGEEVVQIDASNSQPLLLSCHIDNEGYKKDVENGVFYEKLAIGLGFKGSGARNKAKQVSYRWIFFNNKAIPKKYVDVLNSIWPGLGQQINELKENNELWRLLQTTEADIFVIYAINCAYKCLTRHDSIIVRKEDKDKVIAELTAIYKTYGLSVTFSDK
jgi:hypothetical protein